MLSGIKKARLFHRQCWFITLTTSDVQGEVIRDTNASARDVFKRHFSIFVKRARRMFGSFEYIAVHTLEGGGVYHILVNSLSIGRSFAFGGYTGFKALWYWLSEAWLNVHLSPVVWSVLLRGVRRAANYIIGHYLGGQKGYVRYHWSWKWVYAGFVRAWYLLCKSMVYDFKLILPAWHKLIYTKCLSVSLPQVKLKLV